MSLAIFLCALCVGLNLTAIKFIYSLYVYINVYYVYVCIEGAGAKYLWALSDYFATRIKTWGFS